MGAMIRVATLVTVCAVLASSGWAGVITNADIEALPGHQVPSGLGTLDWVLFSSSAGGSGNVIGALNSDDANTALPTGNAKTTANASYITSVGELRAYYLQQFPDGRGGSTVSDMALYVDLNQANSAPLYLHTLNVVLNYALFGGNDPRNNPAGHDLTSAQQNATGGSFSGGTLLASLQVSPVVLAVQNDGDGWADYRIDLGIDPFDPALQDSDRILFHWVSSNHSGGPERVFLGGIPVAGVVIPVPTAAMAGGTLLAALGLVRWIRRRS